MRESNIIFIIFVKNKKSDIRISLIFKHIHERS